MEEPEKKTFNKGDTVPEAGEYVCSPCGYRHTYAQGEQFTECMSCMSGTPDGHDEFVEGLELWEKPETPPAETELESDEKKPA